MHEQTAQETARLVKEVQALLVVIRAANAQLDRLFGEQRERTKRLRELKRLLKLLHLRQIAELDQEEAKRQS
jgi:hypothetical protein